MSRDSDVKGHRMRMRKKAEEQGYSALTDQELLELFLFPLRPRIDTKPMAKALLREFGNFSTIMKSHDQLQQRVSGIGAVTEHHFALIAEMLDRLSFENIKKGNIIANWHDLEYYCIQKLSHEPIECFMMILLDNQNRTIGVETLGGGTVNQMMVYPREVLRLALANNAVNVIIVHNHPSGDKRPSRDDIELTKTLQDALKSARINLHDHLIVAGGSCISLRNLGLF